MSESTAGQSSDLLGDVIRYWQEHPVHSVEFPVGGDLTTYLDRVDALRWSDNERWARQTFYDLAGGAGTRILDGGCGIGVFTRFYARKGFDVHAVDITSKAVSMTQKSLELYSLRAKVQVASVEELPFPENYFDYIVSNGVIHHTPNSEKAVEEFYRVLKPGGLASVCVYYKNALLRWPIWPIVRMALPLLLIKRSGRDGMFKVRTPEDFVRTYDGNDTPIARVYSKREGDRLFSRFRILKREPHYFPVRFLRFLPEGGFVHRILDRSCGCLLYYLLEKS
jgi:SAM-dependent methyltransferase